MRTISELIECRFDVGELERELTRAILAARRRSDQEMSATDRMIVRDAAEFLRPAAGKIERSEATFPWRRTCRASAPARQAARKSPSLSLGGRTVAKKKAAKKAAPKKKAAKKKTAKKK
jgi:hypothetical protein